MKAPKKLAADLIAPCGVNCLACSAYLQAKNACPGCRADAALMTRKSCRTCAKKACAAAQGLTWCFECDRFPCPQLRAMSRRYAANYGIDLVQNGRDGQTDMTAAAARMLADCTCPDCAGVIDRHRGVCSACGRSF